MAEEDWSNIERLSPAERVSAEALIVDVDGFEGPLDLLADAVAHAEGGPAAHLHPATGRSVSGLCRTARALRIELAADYLVMAAWLAF
jgi:segregation and condensation protein A